LTKTYTITLDIPPVHAHNNGHWRARSAKVKACRAEAKRLALLMEIPRMEQATVFYRFFFPDRRVRDEANYIHACKPAMDGIVDAGVIPDDRWVFLGTAGASSEVDRDNPRVEIVLEEREPTDG